MNTQHGAKKRSSRSHSKCDGCRQRKVKCTPADRDWSKGEKCISCRKMDLRCGPNKRHESAVREKRRNREQWLVDQGDSIQGLCATDLSTPTSNAISTTMSESMHPPLGGCVDNISKSQLPSPSGLPTTHWSIQDVNAPSSLSKVRQRITSLRELAGLYICVKHRLHAVTHLCDIDHVPDWERIETALVIVDNRVQQSFCTAIQEFLYTWQKLNSVVAELILTKVLCLVRGLIAAIANNGRSTSLERLPVSLKELKRLESLRSDLVDSLVSLSVSSGDEKEAQWLLMNANVTLQPLAFDGEGTIPENELTAMIQTAENISIKLREEIRELSAPRYEEEFARLLRFPFPPVLVATVSGRLDVAHSLKSKGRQCILETDFLGRNALHLAAEASDRTLLHSIREFVDNDYANTCIDCFGLTALMIAAYKGNMYMFQSMLEIGLDPWTFTNGHNQSVLSISAAAGNQEIVELLLRRDCEDRGASLLRSSAEAARRNGHVALAQLLDQYNSDEVRTLVHMTRRQ